MNKKLSRLTDAFLEGLVDEETVKSKRPELELEKEHLERQLSEINQSPNYHRYNLRKMFELTQSLTQTYEMAEKPQKRKLLKKVSSNFYVDAESVEFKPSEPWMTIQKTQSSLSGPPHRNASRTEIEQVAKKIFDKMLICIQNPEEIE